MAWFMWDDGVGAIGMVIKADTRATRYVADFDVVKGVVVNAAVCCDFGGTPFAPYERPPTVSWDGTKAGSAFFAVCQIETTPNGKKVGFALFI